MDNIRSGTTIRQPSTANLMIDSYDRSIGKASDFTISPPSNILSGFFTRMGVVEVVLDWAVPNISPANRNNTFSVIIASVTYTVTLPTGFYTIATLMTALMSLLNVATSNTFLFVGSDGAKSLTCGVAFSLQYTVLIGELGLWLNSFGSSSTPSPAQLAFAVLVPDITGDNKYIDFTCSNLTYQQGLKDATTSSSSRDVLYRWVLSWEDNIYEDTDGYIIYQGYSPFKSRRYLSYPKQIKWDTQQPLGQLKFELYNAGAFDFINGKVITPQIVVVPDNFGLEFQMTLLVSEQ
jgi:hypothetical protein